MAHLAIRRHQTGGGGIGSNQIKSDSSAGDAERRQFEAGCGSRHIMASYGVFVPGKFDDLPRPRKK